MTTPLIAPPALLPEWAARAINLADPRLGAVRVDVIDPNTLAMRRGDFLVVATRSTSTVQIDERDEVVATWSEVARPTPTELVLSSPGATILRRS